MLTQNKNGDDTMQSLEAYIEENRNYCGDEVLRVLEGLADANWQAVMQAAEAVHGIGAEPGMSGGLVKTHETIADYDTAMRQHWNECSQRKQISDTLVLYRGVQAIKGQQRRDFAVLDLGEYRIVVEG